MGVIKGDAGEFRLWLICLWGALVLRNPDMTFSQKGGLFGDSVVQGCRV